MPIRGVEAEWPRYRSAFTPWGLRLGLLGLATLLVAGLAFRSGAFGLIELFATFAIGSLLALGGLIASIIALRKLWANGGHGAGLALAGAVVAGVALAPATLSGIANFAFPNLNDVSTDLQNPPALAAVAAPRTAAGARSDFTAEVAQRAQAGYPELTPLLLQRPPDLVFEAVRELVEENGWTVASSNPPAQAPGLLVATAYSPLLRFADDVSVRVAPAPQGSRVDMRSASRLGRHDLGANARRVQGFLAALDERLNAAPQ